MEQAGGDATEAFEDNDHSDEAKDMLQDYQIGIVSHKTPLVLDIFFFLGYPLLIANV